MAHCGEWTLRDLAAHLGSENLWAAAAVTAQHGRRREVRAPLERAELLRWFEETSATLLTVLHADPATSAWTFHPPRTVGFWQRRRALEALVHRWDAEHALGRAPVLDPELAGEGMAEVLDTMAPRQVARGRAHPPRSALRLRATDLRASWTYGPGAPVATLSGPAGHLLLLLWGRVSRAHEVFHWTGDREAGAAALAGIATP